MPRHLEALTATDWEADDPGARSKEADYFYEIDPHPRITGWGLRVVRPVAGVRKTFRRSDDQVAAMFATLADEWREATAIESRLERIVLNSSYQQIIGLGPQVLPHILKDMKATRDHWFWALRSIVGEDKAVGQVSVESAVEAWLVWGRQEGLIDD